MRDIAINLQTYSQMHLWHLFKLAHAGLKGLYFALGETSKSNEQ